MQTCRERERAAARSQEDRERLDKLQQEVAHEASANKAQMQQQIVKILQDTQVLYVCVLLVIHTRYCILHCTVFSLLAGGEEQDGRGLGHSNGKL